MTTPWFPNTELWPVQHPDRLQLYTMATPNGLKVSIALEEMGIPYEAHLVNILENTQFDPDYLKLSPNGKIPTILDPNGPAGEPITLMETGAILLYLAEKSGKLMPADPRQAWVVKQWLFMQVAHIGPMFGQFGHFYKFAKGKTSDEYAVTRFTNEAKRLLKVLDDRLATTSWLAGEEYTIADVATFPWVACLSFYDGLEAVEFDTFGHVKAWLERCEVRPATQRGRQVGLIGS
ncbi:glutathione binding-like protein [Salinispirillum marinum]|uniref:Glutathione binding-like protein n=2 Tax=Saccharospirillaceae TaxID=255527 RepID=A0ABV8BHP1_9GAMM